MALAAALDSEKIADDELSRWLSGRSQERRELIVEAAVPNRRVMFAERPGGRPRPVGVATREGRASRADVLEALGAYLRSLLGSPPVELSAAGAFAIEASRQETLRLLENPLVKALRSNRKLALRKPSLVGH